MERESTEEAIRVNEQQDKPPFIVRGHHIVKLRAFLKSGKSSSNFENTYFRDLERLASLFNSGFRLSYLNDVFGSTQEQADKFRRYEEEFLEEFLQLPDDWPVKIVDNQKDKICQGCAIGEHCSKRSLLSLLGYGDIMYIRAFRKAAKKLNLEDDFTDIDEIATYSNARPRTVKSILTTAGTVKKVVLSKSGSFLSPYDVS